MPELPEVETVKRQLAKSLINKTIKDVFVYMDKMVKVGPGRISNIKVGSKKQTEIFRRKLLGKKILDIDRRAKFLIIKFSKDTYLMIHLRMSGQLIFLNKKMQKDALALSLAKAAIKQTLPSKHTHVEFIFSNGDKLFYNDTRQFGHIRLISKEELENVLQQADLGPEPLELSYEDFKEIAKKHKEKRAKDFLLNQSIIAGIGNIYADESLFTAGISPTRKVGKIKEAELELLHSSIIKILKAAIKYGGSSIEYFLMINGGSGKYSDEHLVYGKEREPCPKCKRPLKSMKIGSRTATFCSHCQK